MAGLKVQLIHPIGWQRHARVHWLNVDGCAHVADDGDVVGLHCSEQRIIHVGDVGEMWPPNDDEIIEKLESDGPLWDPTVCDRCSTPPPDDAETGMHAYTRTRWSTPSGWPEIGSLYFEPDQLGLAHFPEHEPFDDPGPMRCLDVMNSDGTIARRGWHNCDSRHLICVLPDGVHWDIDSRANNCTKPEDVTHRCWVRIGRPELGETVHISKDGNTCSAGAGSIATGSYHGFLHHGFLNPTG